MNFKRTRYQFGSLELKKRKKGAHVWAYRYRQPQIDGSVVHKSRIIGTVEQFPTRSDAWKAAEAFRLSANPDMPAQHAVTWGALIDRYLEGELPRRKSTARSYRGILLNHIKPRWGDYPLADVKPFSVEEWLRSAKTVDGKRLVTWKTKKHLRSLMSILYGYAMRWQLVPAGANPFGHRLIRIGKYEERKRRSITVNQFHALLNHPLIAAEPFRTAVIVAICTGLRCEEVFALRWSDINWQQQILKVERGIVAGTIDDTKTPGSKTDVPLAAEVTQTLLSWKQRTAFNTPDDFIFASPFRGGKAPYEPYGIQKDRLRPAGVELGFPDSLGWHTFRHTYRTLLEQTGATASVQQAMMRHTDIHTTLKYGETVTPSKRKANRAVVSVVFRKRKNKRRRPSPTKRHKG